MVNVCVLILSLVAFQRLHLEALDAIDTPVTTDLVEDCHGIPSKGSPKKVILKLSCQKDSRRVLLNKKG